MDILRHSTPPLKTTATPFSGTWFTGKNRKMHVLLFVGVVVIVVISDYGLCVHFAMDPAIPICSPLSSAMPFMRP